MRLKLLKKTIFYGSGRFLNRPAARLPSVNFRSMTTPVAALLFGAVLLQTNATAFAQSTVIIGGSGKSNVVVNLDVLEPSRRSSTYAQSRRILRMPGETMGGVVKLRMPGGMAGTTSGAAVGTRNLPAPKFKLKPPAMPMAKGMKRKPAAMPSAKTARVKVAPMAKPAPAAPRQITKPAPKAPMAPKPPAQAVAPPPPPPPPAVVKKTVTSPPAPAPKVVMAPKPVVTPQPVVAPKPKAAKKVASLPPAKLPRKKGMVSRVSFTGASTRLSEEAKKQLRDLAAQIGKRGDRLQLKAYAGGTNDSSSSARRLSLSRALAVRSYLIESGVRSTRIDVRALGRAADSGPPDRVDMILLVR